MLTFNFNRVLKVRGITKAHKFFTSNGFSPSFATKICKDRVTNVNLKHLEKLCTLLNCTPNDLLQWTPSKDEQQNKNHPLSGLLKEESKISEALLKAPIDKLKDIENFVLGLKEKQ